MSKILEGFSVEDSRKWGLLSGITGFALYFVLAVHMPKNMASLSALYVSLLIFVIRVFWRLRNHVWFWACVLIIVIVDIGTVIIFPANSWPGPSIVVLGFAAIVQVAVSLSIITNVEKVFKRIGEDK